MNEAPKTAETIGLVGSTLAQRLLESGFGVAGCDLDPARMRQLEDWGGRAAVTPAEVAAHADRVVLSLMDSEVVRQVVEGPEGLLQGPHLPRAILDTSTGDPDQTTALAALLAARGVAYLDTPLSGSSAGSRQRCPGQAGGQPGGRPQPRRPG